MFRWGFLLVFVTINTSVYAKEWKNLKTYQKTTSNKTLTISHWLKKDRIKNTKVWQTANMFNLKHSSFQEYVNIEQRRDFYRWINAVFQERGHEVCWITMAHYISQKMQLFEVFPYAIFFRKEVKQFAKTGNEIVFNNVFYKLSVLNDSEIILKGAEATNWDNIILKEEQFNWIQEVYNVMDVKSLKTLKRISKGQCLYGIVVPKSIRFNGELSNPKDRYDYAIQVLKPYTKNRYKT